MPNAADAQIAVSALSLVSGGGLISVGFFLADRARGIDLTLRTAVSGGIASIGAYAFAQGCTLQAAMPETLVIAVASVTAVALFTTRHGRNKSGIGGTGGWGITSTSDLTGSTSQPAEPHQEPKKDAAA